MLTYLFLINKYTRWYYSIVNNPHDVIDQYSEKHHIIPKSLGGGNEKENLVRLSAKEHYICHLLLTKMCNTDSEKLKMLYAFKMMSTTRSQTKTNSKLYKSLKESHSLLLSEKYKADGHPCKGLKRTGASLGVKNTMYGRIGELCPNYGMKRSITTRKKMSESQRTRSYDSRKSTIAFHTGRKRSEETRRKIAESSKGRIKSEKERKGISERMLGKSNFFSTSGLTESEKRQKLIVKSRQKVIDMILVYFEYFEEIKVDHIQGLKKIGIISKYSIKDLSLIRDCLGLIPTKTQFHQQFRHAAPQSQKVY